jgi:DNA-directed RNA polymerase specialized sigma24 family protein
VSERGCRGSTPLDVGTTACTAHVGNDERETFYLAWFLGASQQQIADVMGISPRSVKRLWQRARDGIRQATEGDAPEVTADR